MLTDSQRATQRAGIANQRIHLPIELGKGTIAGGEDLGAGMMIRGQRGGIDAAPILDYKGGVVSDPGNQIDHVISVVGWGQDDTDGQYWIVRNSWGEYWGEMGYVRVAKGNNALHLEEQCSWAVPAQWTEANFPCNEDGSNCQ